MPDSPIQLVVPAIIQYRELAVRTVAAACRLARGVSLNGDYKTLELAERFDSEVVSAFSELFNNIVKHSYGNSGQGEIKISISVGDNQIEINVWDTGENLLDWDSVPDPQLASLPEGGMGLFILRSFVDEVEYNAGPPNTWRLAKRTFSAPGSSQK